MTQTMDPVQVAVLQEGQMESGPTVTLLEEVVETGNAQRFDYDQEIRRLDFEERQFRLDYQFAEMMAKSGAFKDNREDGDPQARAMLKMQIGREVGLDRAASQVHVKIILGSPSFDSAFKAARLKLSGYDWTFIEHTDKLCHVNVTFKGRPLGQVKFTFEEAERGKFFKPDKEGEAWLKTPKDMLYWAVIRRVEKFFASQLTTAKLPSSEELMSLVFSDAPTSGVQTGTESKTDRLKENLANASGGRQRTLA